MKGSRLNLGVQKLFTSQSGESLNRIWKNG